MFFQDPDDEAEQAGYRALPAVHSKMRSGEPPDWIQRLLQQLSDRTSQKVTSSDLKSWGYAPERVRRWFQKHHGMSFTAWWRGNQLFRAKSILQSGGSLETRFSSTVWSPHSGFRTAFGRAFGSTPGRSPDRSLCHIGFHSIGIVLAAADDSESAIWSSPPLRDSPRTGSASGKRFGVL